MAFREAQGVIACISYKCPHFGRLATLQAYMARGFGYTRLVKEMLKGVAVVRISVNNGYTE